MSVSTKIEELLKKNSSEIAPGDDTTVMTRRNKRRPSASPQTDDPLKSRTKKKTKMVRMGVNYSDFLCENVTECNSGIETDSSDTMKENDSHHEGKPDSELNIEESQENYLDTCIGDENLIAFDKEIKNDDSSDVSLKERLEFLNDSIGGNVQCTNENDVHNRLHSPGKLTELTPKERLDFLKEPVTENIPNCEKTSDLNVCRSQDPKIDTQKCIPQRPGNITLDKGVINNCPPPVEFPGTTQNDTTAITPFDNTGIREYKDSGMPNLTYNKPPTNTIDTTQIRSNLDNLLRHQAVLLESSLRVPPPPLQQGQTNETHDSYVKENNALLRSITCTLDEININVRNNGESISSLSFRLNDLERHVDTNIAKVNARLDESEKNEKDIADAMNLRCDENFTYVDQQIEIVDNKYANICSEIGKEVDKKLEVIGGSTSANLSSLIDDKLNLIDFDTKIGSVVTSKMKKHETDINKRLEEADQRIAEMIKLNTSLQDDIKQKLEELNSFTTVGKGNTADKSLRKDIDRLIGQANDNTAWLDGLQFSHDNSVKSIEQLDLLSRRNRIIIEQLDDEDREDTKFKINRILNHTLDESSKAKVSISNAYRLGNKFIPNRSRKILVEFSTPEGRDIVMQNVSKVRKAGNNGKPYFISEDIPESIRRWKSDVNKYVKYLEEHEHEVTRSGDNLIIDGVRYTPTQFNTLPEGSRLCDSRTIFQGGVVAFNSIHSPLSNLYPTRLKLDGLQFNSLEQGYQFLKAKHCNNHALARDLLKLRNPYDIVALMKGDQDNPSWVATRENTMERLLRVKAEQCPEFTNLLRKTEGHKLVENTWNAVWGSCCPFRHRAVWEGSYKGSNRLGLLLEKIRANYC